MGNYFTGGSGVQYYGVSSLYCHCSHLKPRLRHCSDRHLLNTFSESRTLHLLHPWLLHHSVQSPSCLWCFPSSCVVDQPAFMHKSCLSSVLNVALDSQQTTSHIALHLRRPRIWYVRPLTKLKYILTCPGCERLSLVAARRFSQTALLQR